MNAMRQMAAINALRNVGMVGGGIKTEPVQMIRAMVYYLAHPWAEGPRLSRVQAAFGDARSRAECQRLSEVAIERRLEVAIVRRQSRSTRPVNGHFGYPALRHVPRLPILNADYEPAQSTESVVTPTNRRQPAVNEISGRFRVRDAGQLGRRSKRVTKSKVEERLGSDWSALLLCEEESAAS